MDRFIFILRILIAVIYLQTLFFKFTGAEESKFIFSKLGLEPEGRIFAAVMELIVSLMMFYPKTFLLGNILSLGIISGAIFSHIFILGIEIQNDSGFLFILANTIFISNLIILFFNRNELLRIFKKGNK